MVFDYYYLFKVLLRKPQTDYSPQIDISMNTICFSTYVKECCSSTEFANLFEKYSNSRLKHIYGVDIAIIGKMHYYLVKEGADVEKAIRWMKKSVKEMLYDPLMDRPYFDWIHNCTNSELVQIVLEDALSTCAPQERA